MAQGDVSRSPVVFTLVWRIDEADYQPENALFRHMLQDFRRPAWCQELVITADTAYASGAKLALIEDLGYGSVVTLPRTWRFANGHTLNALVTHLSRGK